MFAEGRTEGCAEGLVWGEARVLKRQLTRRFGPLPEWVEAKLAAAEPAQLEAWAERVLDAPMLEAVFAEE